MFSLTAHNWYSFGMICTRSGYFENTENAYIWKNHIIYFQPVNIVYLFFVDHKYLQFSLLRIYYANNITLLFTSLQQCVEVIS